MPIIKANNCDFYCEMAGSGFPLVFIHGETHGTVLFEVQMKYFSQGYQCFTYDRRGHGKSSSPIYGYSMWNQTNDLKHLLDLSGIERAIIVAVAMSTPLASTFTMRFPERVEALVLCSWYELDGYPLLEERRGAYQMTFADLHLQMRQILLERGRSGLEEHLEQHHLTLTPIFPPDKPDVRKKLVQLFASHRPEHYVQSAEYYTSIPNVRAEMHRITCPVLGVCGTDDPVPDRPELLTGVKNFRQEWVKGARRFTMMEYPENFNEILETFISTNKR